VPNIGDLTPTIGQDSHTKRMGFDQRLDEAKMGLLLATSRSKWKLWNTKVNYEKTPGILET